MDFIRQYRIILIGISAVVVIIIGAALFFAITRAGKEPVAVYIIPYDADVTANGDPIREGTIYLEPGTYQLEASRIGFDAITRTITIGQPNTTDIDIALTPNTQDTLEWQQQNQQLYLEAEGRAGQRARETGEEQARQYPIITKLPFRNLLYTIGYRANPNDPSGHSIIVEIDAARGFRSGALNQIRQLGYDPTDYKITFRNYESPFEDE